MKKLIIIFIFVFAAAVGLGIWYGKSAGMFSRILNPRPVSTGTPEPAALDVTPKDVTFKGKLVCLTPIDTGTASASECVLGLATDDGSSYLLGIADISIKGGARLGDTVNVSGTFTPGNDAGYVDKGIIDITSMSIAK